MGEKEIQEFKARLRKSKPLENDSFLYQDYSKSRKIEITFPPPPQPKKQVCTSTTPVKEKSGKKGKHRLLKIISIIGISGLAVGGSVAYIVNMNQYASLDDVLARKTPASLGIDGDTQKRLSELKAKANKRDLETGEKIELVGGIIEFKKDIIKSKIVYAFDISGKPIDRSDVSLIPEQVGENNVQIVIDGIGTYEYKEGEEQKYNISYDIANYITDIVEMQGYESDLKNGVENSDFQEKAKESLDKTDKFAAGEIEVDENGNITIKMKTKAELEGEKLDREVEDDEEYDR